MDKLDKKPSREPMFKWYEYYPGDCDDHKPVLVAFLPPDVMESYNRHQDESDELGQAYINKILGEYGYEDDDIFFYFDEDEYAEVIKDHPDDGDILVEDVYDGL